MSVLVAQCLCGPARHCIIALVVEEINITEAEKAIRFQVDRLILDRSINPHCGLCGALESVWTYEVNPTRFATLDEALPIIRQIEADQQQTRAYLTRAGRTFDSGGVN